MQVTLEENGEYGRFVRTAAHKVGVFNFDPEDTVWHYTDGVGFLGILQSASLHATQVASLNDANETKYATDLYKEAIYALIQEHQDDIDAVLFLNRVLDFVREQPDSPTHATSKFFVSCFSGDENELTQWTRYGKRNGYAIGFRARGLYREPNSELYRVIYDRDKQKEAVKEIADATLRFYRAGLTEDRLENQARWAEVFFSAWDEWIYKLAPLMKDASWKSENEFRIVHELKVSESAEVRFRQREKVLARYLPLKTPSWVLRRQALLPITKIWIGPGDRQAFTRISVHLLLEQMGYPNVPVEISKIALQEP